MQIGTFSIEPALALAPMAGITDKPFRELCRRFGAGYAVGEMVTSNPNLQHTRKTLSRRDFQGATAPVAIQILGRDPALMAEAARRNVRHGAQIIDINMGCPAKKVCNGLAGSALLQDEVLVGRILEAVVKAVNVPVTLKTRLGWDDAHLNLPTIARIAENSGIAALAVHGRSRTQMFLGQARYELIGEVCAQTRLPVWVSGDIDSPHKARAVMVSTGAAGVMIGRAAQGQPWLFRDTAHYLQHGALPAPLPFAEAAAAIRAHLDELHVFYGEAAGVRIARKHLGAYFKPFTPAAVNLRELFQMQTAPAQAAAVAQILARLAQKHAVWPCAWQTHHTVQAA